MIERELAIKKAKEMATKRLEQKDIAIINAVALVNDLNEVINLLSERLTIWYFKGMKKMKADPNILKQIESLDDSTKENQHMKLIAIQIKSLQELRKQTLEYINSTIKELMPNTCSLVGETIAANLLAKAGSFEKLFKYPASTIQVLGAEKSLFKHLRKGAKSPKHGVIFSHPFITRASKKLRGKIARAIATKLSMAIRVDYTTKRDVSSELRKSLEKRIMEITKKSE
ncbi:MAG: NOP58 family protein [Candidatus Micrarchaeota archaeon]|nr:NOP58 family protein [Candidatus Micrarchaeota archaeon]